MHGKKTENDHKLKDKDQATFYSPSEWDVVIDQRSIFEGISRGKKIFAVDFRSYRTAHGVSSRKICNLAELEIQIVDVSRNFLRFDCTAQWWSDRQIVGSNSLLVHDLGFSSWQYKSFLRKYARSSIAPEDYCEIIFPRMFLWRWTQWSKTTSNQKWQEESNATRRTRYPSLSQDYQLVLSVRLHRYCRTGVGKPVARFARLVRGVHRKS